MSEVESERNLFSADVVKIGFGSVSCFVGFFKNVTNIFPPALSHFGSLTTINEFEKNVP